MLFLFATHSVNAQESKRVLFIGNSYTGVNNLPQLTKDLSLSAGDTLIIDSHTPGGQTFQGHFSNATVNTKIAQGNWDFVVLQEQSQRPSFPDSQVESDVFPFAKKLDSLVNLYNDCGETIFYMTWGRKNGDAGNCAFWPPVCTYTGMDSLLYLRYMQMAQDNSALVSPVGKLWNYLRENHPEIELYSSDESHPSLAGSYAAACSFYATIFKKSPILITNDYGLNASDAAAIRNATFTVVFDSLSNWDFSNDDVVSNFTYSLLDNNIIECTNLSLNAEYYQWIVDDTIVTFEENLVHEFGTSNSGIHTIELLSWNNCGDTVTNIQSITIGSNSQNDSELLNFSVFPNPFEDKLTILGENETHVFLKNIDGQIIIESEFKKQHLLELKGISSGVYFLQIKDLNGFIFQEKLIKK